MMSLPVSPEYLQLALTDECAVEDRVLPRILRHRRIGDLTLSTGRLVACDPVCCPEANPFPLIFPQGTFPVILSLAQWCYWDEPGQMVIDEDLGQLVAFAIIRFRQSEPVRWEMLKDEHQDISTLAEGQYFGYGVDSAIGCFMDHSASRVVSEWPFEEGHPARWDVIINAFEESYEVTDAGWGWLDMKFGDANLIAFSTGNGDGVYATYAGFDADGEVAVVVTDFDVVPTESEDKSE